MRRGDNIYKTLGEHLKTIRERSQESVSEASGAVEIDDDRLLAYERGDARPSEDILLLLITHFNIQDDEANELWEQAGYEESKLPFGHNHDDEQHHHLPPSPDSRIVYTDMVHVMVNNFGVVMNFMQGAGYNQPPAAVARVGMSLEHAKSVLDILQKTIQQAEAAQHHEPLRLPKPSANKKPDAR